MKQKPDSWPFRAWSAMPLRFSHSYIQTFEFVSNFDFRASNLTLFRMGWFLAFFWPRTGKADEKADEEADEEVRASETKARFLAVQSIPEIFEMVWPVWDGSTGCACLVPHSLCHWPVEILPAVGQTNQDVLASHPCR